MLISHTTLVLASLGLSSGSPNNCCMSISYCRMKPEALTSRLWYRHRGIESVIQYNVTSSRIFSNGRSSSLHSSNFSPILVCVSDLKSFSGLNAYQLRSAKGLELNTRPTVAVRLPCSSDDARPMSNASAALCIHRLSRSFLGPSGPISDGDGGTIMLTWMPLQASYLTARTLEMKLPRSPP